MQSSDFILDVNESDFESEVLVYSQKKPVVVDFWADWCGPCKVLGPALQQLAIAWNGAFRLAKIDVDSSPNLSKRYNIRSIPAVKAFKDRQVVAEFLGVQPEARLREFIRSLTPGGTDLLLEKSLGLLNLRHWQEAETCFRQFLGENQRHPSGQLGLAKGLLMQGKANEALDLLRNFPDSKELASAENLRPLASAMLLSNEDLTVNDDLLNAAYQNALRLAMRGNLLAAMDGVLEVLRQDKRFDGGRARLVMIALLELMDPTDSLTRQYRNELASVLF
jgi:putative thioredoxin